MEIKKIKLLVCLTATGLALTACSVSHTDRAPAFTYADQAIQFSCSEIPYHFARTITAPKIPAINVTADLPESITGAKNPFSIFSNKTIPSKQEDRIIALAAVEDAIDAMENAKTAEEKKVAQSKSEVATAMLENAAEATDSFDPLEKKLLNALKSTTDIKKDGDKKPDVSELKMTTAILKDVAMQGANALAKASASVEFAYLSELIKQCNDFLKVNEKTRKAFFENDKNIRK